MELYKQILKTFSQVGCARSKSVKSAERACSYSYRLCTAGLSKENLLVQAIGVGDEAGRCDGLGGDRRVAEILI